MSTYIVNPVEVRMEEDKRGTLYPAIVAMSLRANDLAVYIRQKLEERIADLIGDSESEGDIYTSRRLQEEQLRIALEFESIPKPTFLAMKERFTGQLEYRIPEVPESPIDSGTSLSRRSASRWTSGSAEEDVSVKESKNTPLPQGSAKVR